MGFKLNVQAIDGLETIVKNAALKTMLALKTEVQSAQVVPFDNGTLQGSMFVQQEASAGDIHTALITDGPQARRLYFHPEYNFQTGNNPNARANWLEAWTALGAKHDFIPNTFASELKKELP